MTTNEKDAEFEAMRLKIAIEVFGCLPNSSAFTYADRLRAAIETPLRAEIEKYRGQWIDARLLQEELSAAQERIKELATKHEVACNTITTMQQQREEYRRLLKKRDADCLAISTEDADEFNAHHEAMLSKIAALEAQLSALKVGEPVAVAIVRDNYVIEWHAPYASITKPGDRLYLHSAPAKQEEPAMNIDTLVNRFLSWKLPKTFSPDAGISFNPEFNVGTAYPMRHEPTGTNLLNADEARQMLEHVLAGYSAPAVPDGMVDKVALAYGYLWHVNNEPAAPIPMYSPERAAYEARKILRDLMTHEQRGVAINKVAALLAAAQQGTEEGEGK
jgi:hypothetical protein